MLTTKQNLGEYLALQYSRKTWRDMVRDNALTFEWFASLAAVRDMHPLIVDLLDKGDFLCADIPKLVSEYPHESREEKGAIAYAQNEEKARRNLFTRTKLGKYIRRHFPGMTDEDVRRIAQHWAARALITVSDKMADILAAVNQGPYSCMTDRTGHWGKYHPYTVYAPEYGWRVAIRRNEDGDIVGRAMINNGVFVRTYARNEDNPDAYGQPDEMLRDYLQGEGYSYARGWPKGTKLARRETRNGDIICPYIDGETQSVDDCGEYLKITPYGEYDAAQTGGFLEIEGRYECEDCGDRMHEDEMQYAGMYQDRCICEGCATSNYSWVELSRNGRYTDSYLLPDEDLIKVNGTYYHPEYLPDDIVCDVDGEYRSIDDCVFIDSESEYYPCDDSRIVQCEDGDYRLREDCTQCAYSDEWYASEDLETAPDGAMVHPDNMDDYCMQESIGEYSPQESFNFDAE